MGGEDRSYRVEDVRGRVVVLSAERWRHFCEAHPELEPFRAGLLRAIESAEHVIPGAGGWRREWVAAKTMSVTIGIVGVTLVGARRLLDEDGELQVTLPVPERVPTGELRAALAA